ncbi:hypothetical protein FOPG_19790 [Fusarium oxysporum f. sp. conglutinans race 2 54008]|uniref:Uncharacterized protein n=1 Tax=Fusarium oxysporum f. sp. conglutinans race 2 54008 TaxID=1089457 RepID=X0GVJ6_FUSOX|nr:hypothetical protein FOPG_19790 [Fusarium oxysporum f. sp. conglutinans race 2 54008]
MTKIAAKYFTLVGTVKVPGNSRLLRLWPCRVRVMFAGSHSPLRRWPTAR